MIKKIICIVIIVLIMFISLSPFIGYIRNRFNNIKGSAKDYTEHLAEYLYSSLCTSLPNEALVLFAGGYLLYKLTDKKKD